MTTRERYLGVTGESIACRFLVQKGYRILARNYTCRIGEADIVCQDKEVLVVVEVKTYHTDQIDPREVITRRKQQKLIRVAQYYLTFVLKRMVQVRFDLVTVRGDRVIHHLPHIIWANDRN